MPKELVRNKDLNLTISFSKNQLHIIQDSNVSSHFHLNDFSQQLLQENPRNNNNLSIKILFQRLELTSEGNIGGFSD